MSCRARQGTKGSVTSHPGGFAGIPRIALETSDFLTLSMSAKVVLLFLAYQYRGKNNGDLSAAHSLLKSWGISSKTTLAKALRELEKARLIQRTREGRFLNPGGQCALYALTWQPINECGGKLDIGPTVKPLRAFSLERGNNKSPGTDSGTDGIK